MRKKPQPDPQCCACCRHFDAEPGADVGLCKRYPPIPLIIEDSMKCAYPVIDPEDFCGEFARRLNS